MASPPVHQEKEEEEEVDKLEPVTYKHHHFNKKYVYGMG